MVNGSPDESDDDDDEGGLPQRPPSTFTERFHEEFPFYLAIGMTPEQYWDGDASLTKAYRKAYELKQKQVNRQLWMQGMYVYEAICDASPIYNFWSTRREKARPYPTEPYPITKQEILEKRERDAKRKQRELRKRMRDYMNKWNPLFRKKEGGESDG